MQQAEVTHGTELGRLEGDVARVLAERRPLLEKLQSIEAVEDAVRELYLQMKERTAERIAPNLGQLEAERQALKKENILVVLGRLKGNLKNLWAFKVRATLL